MAIAGLLAVGGAVSGSAVSRSALAPLPLRGTTPTDERYRLQAAAHPRDEDVPVSWCLKLRYTSDFILSGDPFVAGAGTCGPAPAPPTSGLISIDCRQRVVFVFGAARSRVRGLKLQSQQDGTTRARLAELPPHAGFAGKSFLLVVDLDALPAVLRERHSSRPAIVRIPAEDEVCEPHPGAPEGGQPLISFPEP